MKMVSFIRNDDGSFSPCSQGGEDFLKEYRAALARAEAAEATLCRARKLLLEVSRQMVAYEDDGEYKCWFCNNPWRGNLSVYGPCDNADCLSNGILAALSSSAPCPHEAEAKRLREEIRRLMQSNLELLDEQKTIKRDLLLWTDYGHKRGIDVVDLFPPRRAGSAG